MDETVTRKVSSWYCVGCSFVLGEVIGGELTPSSALPGDAIRTRGANLVLTCPTCGSKKIWYTADPLVRAIYQMLDAITTTAAKRLVFAVAHDIDEFREHVEKKYPEES